MATTLHEWKCPTCGRTAYSRTKDKPGFIRKAIICRNGHAPVIMKGTGNSHKKYSLRELL